MTIPIHDFSNLVEVADLSIQKYPHLWTLEGDQLINKKHQIIVRKKMIEARADNGIMVTHKLFRFFNVPYAALVHHFEDYKAECYLQKERNLFPLDLIYSICEDFELNFLNWTSNGSQLINQKKEIVIDRNVKGVFTPYTTINGIKITQNQSVDIQIRYSESRNAFKAKNQNFKSLRNFINVKTHLSHYEKDSTTQILSR